MIIKVKEKNGKFTHYFSGLRELDNVDLWYFISIANQEYILDIPPTHKEENLLKTAIEKYSSALSITEL